MANDFPNDDLLDVEAACRFFGGTKPLAPCTLYRGIAAKRFPKPVKIGGASRWIREECKIALAAIIAGQRGEADEAA